MNEFSFLLLVYWKKESSLRIVMPVKSTFNLFQKWMYLCLFFLLNYVHMYLHLYIYLLVDASLFYFTFLLEALLVLLFGLLLLRIYEFTFWVLSQNQI